LSLRGVPPTVCFVVLNVTAIFPSSNTKGSKLSSSIKRFAMQTLSSFPEKENAP
jgi:hypothetical protein